MSLHLQPRPVPGAAEGTCDSDTPRGYVTGPHEPMLTKILVPGWSVCIPPASCMFLWRRGSSSDGSEAQLLTRVSHNIATHFTLDLHRRLELGGSCNTTAVFSSSLSPFLYISFYPASPCNISLPLPLTCPLKSFLYAHSQSSQHQNKHSVCHYCGGLS